MNKSSKIRKRKGKDQWKVYSEKGKPMSKWLDSKKKAKERLKQIEFFKHKSNSDDLSIIDLVDQSNYDMPTLNRKNIDVTPHYKKAMYVYPGGTEVLGGKQTPNFDDDGSEDYYKFFGGEDDEDLPPINQKESNMSNRNLRINNLKLISNRYHLDTFDKLAAIDYMTSSTNSLSLAIYTKCYNYAIAKCYKEKANLDKYRVLMKEEGFSNKNIKKEALDTSSIIFGLGALAVAEMTGSTQLITDLSNGISTLYSDIKDQGSIIIDETSVALSDLYDYVTQNLGSDLYSIYVAVDGYLLDNGIDLSSILQNAGNQLYNSAAKAFTHLGLVFTEENIIKIINFFNYFHHEKKRANEFFSTEIATFFNRKKSTMVSLFSEYIDGARNVYTDEDVDALVIKLKNGIMRFCEDFEIHMQLTLYTKAKTKDFGPFDFTGLDEGMVQETIIRLFNFDYHFQRMFVVYENVLKKYAIQKYRNAADLALMRLNPDPGYNP